MSGSPTTTGPSLPPPPPSAPSLPLPNVAAALNPAPPLPPVVVPAKANALDQAEDLWYTSSQKLDQRLRRFSGYGAIALALTLYGCGLFAAGLFLGLWPEIVPRATPDMWHIVVSTLVALFSVPTFLILGVLRTTQALNGSDTDTLHSAIGEKVMFVLDKLIDKIN